MTSGVSQSFRKPDAPETEDVPVRAPPLPRSVPIPEARQISAEDIFHDLSSWHVRSRD